MSIAITGLVIIDLVLFYFGFKVLALIGVALLIGKLIKNHKEG